MSDPNKQPNKLPTPGGSPNWGVMILMAVIAGILMVAFMFDGALASPGRSISLEQFRQDYKAGKVVLSHPKEFPIEVILDSSSTEGTITAFERMEAKANKMLDEANAMAELNKKSATGDVNDLMEKYENAPSSAIEDELAALKAKLGK